MSTELIRALMQSSAYPHAVSAIDVVETHISWVVRTGDYAYKIKKPVNFGFLDFSTLALRRRFCEEEVRLNRRYAPSLYLGVVAIGGSEHAPLVDSDTTPFEYAVRMRQFDASQTLDRLLLASAVDRSELEQFAAHLAHLHATAPIAPEASDFGSPTAVAQPVLEDFEQIRTHAPELARTNTFAQLEHFARAQTGQLAPEFARRKREGRVRECHGDLHCGNLVRLNGVVTPFDCIEFNANLRWIDTQSELAFLLMDLDARGHPELGRCVLNTYLETSGDYDGVPLLRYYQCYRATVRAKVAAIRAHGSTGAARAEAMQEAQRYLDLAHKYTQRETSALVVMHGVSGAGKSVIARQLAEQWGAIRVRSDVERKRLAGVAPLARGDATMYTPAMTAAVYARLFAVATTLLGCGYRVVLDAAFLRRNERDDAQHCATRNTVALAFVACTAPLEELRARIARRRQDNADASDADLTVLDAQLKFAEPLAADESHRAIYATPDTNLAELMEQLDRIISRYRSPV